MLIFFVIFKLFVKQLAIFERTVVAASDFKNCTMVHCGFTILLIILRVLLKNIKKDEEFAEGNS